MSTRPNAAVATTSSKLFLVVAFAVGYAVGVHSVSDTGAIPPFKSFVPIDLEASCYPPPWRGCHAVFG